MPQLLVLDPEKRMTIEEAQQHPWIVKHCVKTEKPAQRGSSQKEAR